MKKSQFYLLLVVLSNINITLFYICINLGTPHLDSNNNLLFFNSISSNNLGIPFTITTAILLFSIYKLVFIFKNKLSINVFNNKEEYNNPQNK